MRTQEQKATAFRALHERDGAFIIPNPWDAGTAKLLAALGFEALATTSLGLANTLGRVDGAGAVSREEVLANCAQIAGATELPVSADLENCYADEPRAAAELIRLAAEAGVVGGSLSRLALAYVLKAARNMKERGDFTWMAETMPASELRKFF